MLRPKPPRCAGERPLIAQPAPLWGKCAPRKASTDRHAPTCRLQTCGRAGARPSPRSVARPDASARERAHVTTRTARQLLAQGLARGTHATGGQPAGPTSSSLGARPAVEGAEPEAIEGGRDALFNADRVGPDRPNQPMARTNAHVLGSRRPTPSLVRHGGLTARMASSSARELRRTAGTARGPSPSRRCGRPSTGLARPGVPRAQEAGRICICAARWANEDRPDSPGQASASQNGVPGRGGGGSGTSATGISVGGLCAGLEEGEGLLWEDLSSALGNAGAQPALSAPNSNAATSVREESRDTRSL